MIMERKVGEIFEYNGEWYQCKEGTGCYRCAFNYDGNTCIVDSPYCICRSDKKNVIFKKLEKVGEPFVYEDKVLQRLRSIDGYSCVHCLFKEQACNFDSCDKDSFLVETKLKSEDMEEKKLNLRPFDLEAAKAGKPVCTRDGRKARIICFDLNNKNFPIVAIINCDTEENAYQYDIDGVCDEHDNNLNLMMSPEKKEGWVNLCKNNYGDTLAVGVFPNREEAVSNCPPSYLGTIKIEWEE